MSDLRKRPVVHMGAVGDDDLVDWPDSDPDDGAARSAASAVDDGQRDEARDDDEHGDDVHDEARDDEARDDEARDDETRDDDAHDDDDDDARDDGDVDDDDDDDDARDDDDEPDAEGDGDDHAPTAPAAPARGRIPAGAWLLAGAGMLWATVMMLRCRPEAEIPSANIPGEHAPRTAEPPVAPDAPEQADARNDAAPPVPEFVGPGPDADEAEPPEPGMPDTDRLPRHDPAWASGLELPSQVRYTVRRGGSLENVANLFKIFHHEILALNPGLELDRELAPNTRVVVWKRDDAVKSESVGFPSAGTLEGGVPMMEGKGRRILAIPWKTWGTATTVAMLDVLLDRWAARGNVQPILVGNMANRTGGRLEPHSTHQSGRDVDLGYPQVLAAGAELNWQEMNAKNLDAAETWALLFLLADSGAVEEIYIDRELQKLLHDYALSKELLSKAALAKWMEYPRPTGTPAFIQHVNGHTDHLHVRFSCAQGQSRCKSR